MSQSLAIALGGAVGALLRYWVSSGVLALTGRAFPWGTMVVNVIGSVLIGVALVTLVERFEVAGDVRAGIIVGVLGAFTTFSTFSLDTLLLIESGRLLAAGANVLLSVVICVAGCWVGVAGARALV